MTDANAPERIWAHIEQEEDGSHYIEHLGDEPFGDDSVEYIRADLTPKVTVKPLEWRGPFPCNGFKRGRWTAGEFSIQKKDEEFFRVYRDLVDEKDRIYESLEDAKAAAQADYERRILSAVEITTAQGDSAEALTRDLPETQVPGPSNHYGGLLIQCKDGKPEWCIEDCGQLLWEPCPPDVFAALRALVEGGEADG